MGDLAINLAIYYQIGTARGDYSLLSSMDVEKGEFFSVFGKSINDLILRHRVDLNRKRWQHTAGPNAVMGPRTKSQLALNPKARWVNATPEYSLHICGLRKLFPEALFIHIFRDVTSVVRSMLHFRHVSGQDLVANAQEAYTYWLKTVSQCLLAERAYGHQVVFRLRYSDIVAKPEATLQSLFVFLGEPFAPECLQPLAQRINSSNVPDDFVADDPSIDSALVDQATKLSAELETTTTQVSEPSHAAADALEADFLERTKYVAALDKTCEEALRLIRVLESKAATENEAAFEHT